MAGRKKKEEAVESKAPKTNEDIFEAQLAAAGLAGALQVADKFDNSKYEFVTTGYPGINAIINSEDPRGLPKATHSEWFSLEEHAGKTSLALGIGVTWQLLGLRVGVVDIEPSVKTPYLRELGYITSKEEASKRGLYAVRLLQPTVNLEENTTDMVYVETVLNVIGAAAKYFDLLIVDSVDALVSEKEAEKNAEDNSQVGGVSKKIKEWFRKNSTNRAHIMWINHGSMTIPGPGGYPKLVTTGGKAVPRYSTLRFRIDRVEPLKENKEAEPYGFISRVTTIKNRLDIFGKSTNLYYIHHEGFSKNYDYFRQGLKLGILNKNGGWFYFGTKEENLTKGQGEFNFYKHLRDERPDLMEKLKQLIDGEDVEPETEEVSADELLLLAAEASNAEAEEDDGTHTDV